MKLISKKTIWFTVITTLCLAAVTLFAVSGCDKSETPSKYYTINFVGEGIDITPQSIEHGSHATKPENPEREGYNFGGWFTDNDTFADEWDFETDIVTQDTTLYAKWEENNLQDYPIKIPFTEYSLVGNSCQWVNLNYDDNIFVINSNEQLANYINCQEENYPEINFSKNTLLLAYGKAPSSIVRVNCSSLQQYSEKNYKMEVEILVGDATVISNWQVPIMVDKVGDNDIIELVTTIIYSEL